MFALIYGKPGTGKTTLACSLAKKMRVLLIDVDNKARFMVNLKELVESKNLEIFPIAEKLTSSTLRDRITSPKTSILKKPQGYLMICDKITELEQKEPMHDVIVLDSLTSVQEHMKRLVMSIQGRDKFTYEEWAIILANLEELIVTMNYLTEKYQHVILIAHEMIEKDELTGKIEVLPFVEGQMRNKIGKYFTEVFYTFVESQKNAKPLFKVATVSNERFMARTTMNLDPIETCDLVELLEKGGVLNAQVHSEN